MTGGGRAHRDHGLRAGRFHARAHPRRPWLLGRGDRPGSRRVPAAGLVVQGQEGDRDRLRPDRPRGGGNPGCRCVRGGEQRRQLERDRRPGGARVVRRGARRGPHLRPAPRRGIPAARHPDRGYRPLDGRPDAATAAPRGSRGALAGSDRGGGARRGDLRPRLGGRQGARDGGDDRSPGCLHHAAGRGDAARPGRGAPRGRCRARDSGTRRPGGPPGRTWHAQRPRPARAGEKGTRQEGEGGALMRVAIAGAGAVGRSIARELLDNGHEVLLIDKSPRSIKVDSLPRAEWLLADACEITSLDEAGLERCNVVIAATGDDKVNLVVSLLAKTEYGVPRVVARINHPNNEWLFNESWVIDVAVSTPRLLSALVEEAVSVGDLVRLMTFRQSEANLVELTMPSDAPLAGQRVGSIDWPSDTALVAILRDSRVIVPGPDDPLEAGDELLFVTSQNVERELAKLLGCAA